MGGFASRRRIHVPFHPARGSDASMTIAQPPIEVLLVEDNPADVRLTLEVMKDLGRPARLTPVHDGLEAVTMLDERCSRRESLPDLVLLDLNLPRMHGSEVLERIKRAPLLRHLPVIVLTTSQAEQDVRRSYELGANAFLNKPMDLDSFAKVMQGFVSFWLDTAKLWRQ